MRVTKYVRSDEENWQMVRIRHSPHMADSRLDDLMLKNGWVRFSKIKNFFDTLRKRLAKQTPGRHWKDVKIPMMAADRKLLPAQLQSLVEPANEPAAQPKQLILPPAA